MNKMTQDLTAALAGIVKNPDGSATVPAENLTPTRGALIFGIVAANVLPGPVLHFLMGECSRFVTEGARMHAECTDAECKARPADATQPDTTEDPA